MATRFSAALDALPPDFCAVLMLVDVQELNYKEVAQCSHTDRHRQVARLARPQMMRTALGALRPPAGLVR